MKKVFLICLILVSCDSGVTYKSTINFINNSNLNISNVQFGGIVILGKNEDKKFILLESGKIEKTINKKFDLNLKNFQDSSYTFYALTSFENGKIDTLDLHVIAHKKKMLKCLNNITIEYRKDKPIVFYR